MSLSKDETVRNFLNDLKAFDHSKFEIIIEIRELIFDTYQELEEKVMYGGIIFFLKSEMFGGLFAYKNHVSLEFSNGFLMEDPNEQLEGQGKYRRHLKIKNREDIITKEVAYYVKQAVLA